MTAPTPSDLLAAPWTQVSVISRILLVAQVIAVIAGLVPALRAYLRQFSWFVAFIAGPPLLWCLFEISLGLVLFFSSIGHFHLGLFFDWAIGVFVVVGTTVILQSMIAVEYARKPLSTIPVVGVVIGLVTLLGDVLFLIIMVTPWPPTHP